MLTNFFNFLLSITEGLGYTGLMILMAIESSFIPMPSEIIIPPAAYLASLGKMNIFIIILMGTLGSLIGAIFNYTLGYYLGRPIVYKLSEHKLAKFVFVNRDKLEKAENYFLKNSKSATFIGRLVPVIRQLISIPAGFCKMNFWVFIFYTALGSFIWVSLLAILGYFIGSNHELFMKYYKETTIILLLLGLIYFSFKIYKIKKNKNQTNPN
jgi:membrane protein DedA with SNARE-associated domain